MSVHGVIPTPGKAAVYCAAGRLSCKGRTERETEREMAAPLSEAASQSLTKADSHVRK